MIGRNMVVIAKQILSGSRNLPGSVPRTSRFYNAIKITKYKITQERCKHKFTLNDNSTWTQSKEAKLNTVAKKDSIVMKDEEDEDVLSGEEFVLSSQLDLAGDLGWFGAFEIIMSPEEVLKHRLSSNLPFSKRVEDNNLFEFEEKER
jgi:hypothetical protein